MGVANSQSCKQILTQADRSHRADQVGLGFEYLRLAGVPTLVWIASSSAIVSLQRYRAKDLNQFGYSIALVVLALAFGALLTHRNRLKVATSIALDGILLALTAYLWRWISPSSNLLQLMTYALLFYGVFATVIGMSNLSDLNSENSDNLSSLDNSEPASTEIVSASSTHKFSWKWIGVVLVVGLVLYMVIAPAVSMAIDHFTPKRSTRELTDMSFLEHLRLQSVSGIVMLLFLATGASIGSFLNVVIYRLPRRRTLLWPASACPNCGYKIKGTDNLPILAWIGLRGRCRQCHVSISSRYPIIEATVAVVFVVFFYVLLLSGGQNLPVRDPNIYRGIVWIILYTKWDLVTMYFFHMSIFAILLAWAMINWDRFRVPLISAIGYIVLSVVLVTLFPHLNPIVPRQTSIASFIPTGLWVAISGAGIGGIAGMLLQYLFTSGIATISISYAPTESPSEPRDVADSKFNEASAISDPVDPAPADALSVASIPSAIAEETASTIANLENEHVASSVVQGPSADGSTLETVEPKDLYGAMAKQPASMTDAALCLALFGSAFGPQAVLSIMLVSLVIQALAAAVQKLRGQELRFPVTLTLFVVAVLHTAVWRQSSYLPIAWWPTPEASARTIAIWSATTTLGLVVLASLRFLLRSQLSVPTNSQHPAN